MKSRITEETMALLGGAVLGAAAMYFLDSQAGPRRRGRIASAAGHLPHDARAALQSGGKVAERWFGRAQHGLSQARNAAHAYADDPANRINSHAHEHLSHLRDVGSHLWNRARGVFNGVPDMAAGHAQHLRDQLADRSEHWRRRAAKGISRGSHQAQSWLGHEERSGFGAGTVLSSTLGCCAVGAGLVYFLDSTRGRQRRAWVADKTMECIHRTGKAMRNIGQAISGRLHGVDASGRNLKDRIDSEQLVRRIRSELSGASLSVNQIQFMADADGTVTVTGNINPDNVEGLLTALHGIPGVEHVINRMVIDRSNSRSASNSYSAPA